MSNHFGQLFIKLMVFLSFGPYLTEIFHEMTKMIDGGQTQGSLLSILNLMNQNEELYQSQGPGPAQAQCGQGNRPRPKKIRGTKIIRVVYLYKSINL